jgi:tetratricopeptide (TPR) repeat protein
MPDFWTVSKYRPVPHGLFFRGHPLEETLDAQPLIDASRSLENSTGTLLLSKTETAVPLLSRLNAMLRLKMGFSVNELGNLLEDLQKPDDAFAAYQRATQIDPNNVSALMNAYALAKGGHAKHSQTEALKQRLRKLLEDRAHSQLGLQGIFLNYGTIHQSAFYQQEAETWLARGAKAISVEKSRKALDLSQRTDIHALIDRAYYYSISGESSQAEACYQAVLEQDASNFDALYGITLLQINTCNIPNAELWLARANSSKNARSEKLLYASILLAILKGDTTQADKLLAESTKQYPAEEPFWKLRAVFLLKQGNVFFVRQHLLPEMIKALKNQDHYLIHIVRGLILKQQGKNFYREARISLLKGLSLNASMTEIWNVVLELDMFIGSLELMESDLRHLLTLEPDHAQANYMKGSIQLARGNIPSAEDFFRRSIEKAPSALACNDLAEILRRQKKYVEAKAFAHQALEIDPKLSYARETLAAVLADTEKAVVPQPAPLKE